MLIRKDLAKFINQIEKLMLFLLEQKKVTKLENFFIIRDTLISGMCCLEKVGVTDCFNDYLSCLQEIMDKTQDFQKKPIILMLEWKLSLIINNDYVSAEQFYQKSKLFADIIENSYLVTMLEKQWQEDLKKYL